MSLYIPTTFTSPIINICGDLTVLNDIKSKNIKITGSIDVHDDVTCENISIVGSAYIKSELCAENVEIKSSNVSIFEIHAEKVIIKKPFTIGFRKKQVNVVEIECTSIEADLLNCKRLCVDNAKLSKNCVIDSLEYTGEIVIESGCTINKMVKITE